MNLFFVTHFNHAKTCKFIIYMDQDSSHTLLAKQGLSETVLGREILHKKNKTYFFLHNAENIHDKISEVSSTEDITVDLRHITNVAKYSLMINMLRITSMKPHIYGIFLLDRPKFKKQIRDMICKIESCSFSDGIVTLKTSKMCPERFCHKIETIFSKNPKVLVSSIGESTLREHKLQSILDCCRGSSKPPRLLTIEYFHNLKSPLVCIIGNMELEHPNESAIAETIGAMRYFARTKNNPKYNIVLVIPIVQSDFNGGSVIASEAVSYCQSVYAPKYTLNVHGPSGHEKEQAVAQVSCPKLENLLEKICRELSTKTISCKVQSAEPTQTLETSKNIHINRQHTYHKSQQHHDPPMSLLLIQLLQQLP